ncbi:DUF192 domain-containing protein [Natronorarus salvus]|uniref:DUF192 domain-containing protein n=1 Tax=Natronorarus salvus TaxID=3117733 RepID=UPI002F26BFAB
MVRRRGPVALALLFALIALSLVVVQLGLPVWTGSDRATVTVSDGERTLATVDAAVADSPGERYTGLSDHENLAEDEGMLFVFAEEGERAFVMREMAFGIDILFVSDEGEITAIYEAPADSDERYVGDARWVLEVRKGYAAENGIDVGDEVEIEYH